jgi:hypothetical protein
MLNVNRRNWQAGRRGVQLNGQLLATGAAILIAVIGAMTVNPIAAVPPLPDFTVNLNPVSGRIPQQRLLVADKLTGNYSEVLTVTSPNTFAVAGYWDAGQLVYKDGTIPYTARESRLGLDYGLYAVFKYDGTFVLDGSGSVQFAVTSGSLTLYVDPRTDTSKTLPLTATPPIVLSDTDDDAILGSATVIFGAAHAQVSSLVDSGDFALAFNPVVLTTLGSRYFAAPVPFYTGMQFRGQFNSFDASNSQQINGSADVWMQ